MMKNRVKSKQNNFTPGDAPHSNFNQSVLDQGPDSAAAKAKKVNDDLMIRLAMGKKVTVDKKEMKKLTKQNYENLPEIKKKKEEEKKKQEHMNRKVAAAQYMKEFNEKRK
jgi:ALMS motif